MAEVTPGQVGEVALRHLEAVPKLSDPILEAAAAEYGRGNDIASLEDIASIIPHDPKDVDRGLVRRLSTARDEDSGEKIRPAAGSRQEQRLKDASKVAESSRRVAEKGTLNPEFKQAVVDFLTHNRETFKPILEAAVKEGAAVDITAAIEGLADKMIRSDSYRRHVAKLYTERLDPSKKLEGEAAVATAEIEKAELEALLQEEVTEVQINDAKSRFETAEGVRNTSSTDRLQLETKRKRYERLERHVGDAQDTVDRLGTFGEKHQKEIDALRIRLSGIDTSTPEGEKDEENLKNRIRGLERDEDYRDYIEAKSIVDEHGKLEEDIKTLQEKIGPQELEYERAKREYEELLEKRKQGLTPAKRAEVKAKLSRKKAELADAMAELEAEMIGVYRDITGIPQDAVIAFFKDVNPKIKTAIEGETKMAKTEDDARFERINEKLGNLIKTQKKDKKTGLTYWEVDKKKAEEWLQAYLEGGVEGLSQKLLAEVMRGGKVRPGVLKGLGMSDDEIKTVTRTLENEESRKAYLQDNSQKLGTEVIANWFSSGGRMSESIVKSFVSSETGQKFFKQIIDRVAAIDKGLAENFGKGITTAGENLKRGQKEWWKKNWMKVGLAIAAVLLLLFGISVAKSGGA